MTAKDLQVIHGIETSNPACDLKLVD